jgi:transposase
VPIGPFLAIIAPMSDAAGEIAALHARLAERDAELAERDTALAARDAALSAREAALSAALTELTGARVLIEQYKAQLAKLRRMQFGRSSEKLDGEIEQFELRLEDLEEGEGARTAAAQSSDHAQHPQRERRQPVRRPLPAHLPREEM